ncbi:TetR/AcrR family transcriptional regulator [Camelliibacillus cellulosilyticus]|uniref:TetR/AcrR family transcriptional regulator n=1 Tax=Camelliibacillus cellulosilyticus TaxID=2174486 RepID=A0ABV9GTD8_9BACL
MSKIVDHEKRKERIAEACWRVIRKGGLEHATVRKIAKEAGLSVGALRHYFSTQSELFIFAMNLVIKRMTERSKQKLAASGEEDPFGSARAILKFLLPIDKERKLEMEVWYAFTAKSLNDSKLKPLSDQMYKGIYNVSKLAIDTLIKANLLKQNIDVEMEIERLFAVVDGLAVHCILKPDQATPNLVDSVITHHLESICNLQ